MVLQRWDPILGIRRFDRIADRFWRGFDIGPAATYRSLPLDVVEEDNDILVQASVPGVRPEDIQVSVEDGVLTIEGETRTEHEENGGSYLVRERRFGKYRRALRLPDTLDADKGESRYESGVLTVKFPKVEAKKAKKLEVKVAN